MLEARAGKCEGSNSLKGESLAAMMALQMAKEWSKTCVLEGDSQMLINECVNQILTSDQEIVEEVHKLRKQLEGLSNGLSNVSTSCS